MKNDLLLITHHGKCEAYERREHRIEDRNQTADIVPTNCLRIIQQYIKGENFPLSNAFKYLTQIPVLVPLRLSA